MSLDHSGNSQPSIDKEEHDSKNVNVKKVGIFGYSPATDEYVRINVSPDGSLAGATTTSRYDIQDPIYYVGEAAIGTPEATASWTITKYDLTATPYSGKVATGTAWADRASGSYN